MQASDIRKLSDAEVDTKLDESRQALRNLRFQRATGQLTDMTRMRAIKRDIARYETIKRERALATATATAAQAKQ